MEKFKVINRFRNFPNHLHERFELVVFAWVKYITTDTVAIPRTFRGTIRIFYLA